MTLRLRLVAAIVLLATAGLGTAWLGGMALWRPTTVNSTGTMLAQPAPSKA